ncbi:TonB-dependent receptor [Bacteroides sp.]|uniref:SusC/RagA family TonB-linked outer membrane protein n=1 Tax=Bacteroides sp. TaxID=29523 RepID=UPI0026352E43|nr:TonB-dependent receptor [Bacteroides sp.]
MRKHLFFSVMLSLCAFGGMAVYSTPAMATVTQSPTIKVRGQVIDEQGEPMPGATVKIKGGQGGTITDLDGNFQLEVPGNAILSISYVGFKEREVAVRNRAIIETIQLQSDDQMLEQVVVVGYGTQKKSDLTGSVSVVDAEALKQTSNSNISTMLEGKVSGVQITSDGQPGADPSVRIRGIGSFGDTSPLYVIDGVPMGTSIRDFSSNDIETIQVLKDASAAAIYGSRAANGVIIITTKRGQKDQPLKVDYNGYFGMDYIPKGIYDVMDADQYSQYIGQACVNSNTPLPSGYKLNSETGKYHFQDNTNTDWFDEVFKMGIRQNHNVNLAGGGAHNTYNISLDYFNQKGTLEGAGPNYERYTARVNNTMDTKFVKFQTSLVYSHSNQDNMGLSNASEYVQGLYGDVTNVLRGSMLMQPTIKAYDSSTWVLDNLVGIANNFNYDAYGYGVYYDTVHGDISASNPLLVNNLLQRNTRVDRFVGTGSADVDILKMIGVDNKNHRLNYKVNLSYSKTHCKDFTWIPAWVQSNRVYLAKSNERLTKGSRDYSDALIENVLTYDGTIGKHHINVLAGQTYEEENTDLLTGWGINFTEPYFLQLQNAANTYSESYEYKHSILSYIGRINYNYDDRYLFSATVRRDGSSRLTRSIRWGTFPSVSVGWRFDKENFFPFDQNVVNLFKVRASYGELGNENIGEYMYQAVMSRNNMTYNFNGNVVTGSAISTFVDNNLSWEKKKTYNVGIDIALFRNRLEFTAEWYKNISEDLLYSVPVPEQAGVSNTTVTMNAASMNNSGFEFSATYRNRDHAFKYELSANLSTVRNRVTSLGFGTNSYISGAFITNVGQEIGQFYGWVYDGIARTQEDLDNHATQEGAQIGDCLYKDVSGPDGVPDGKVDANDQVILGSGMPKINFGINARFEYKRFDLSIATFGTLNHHVSDDIYNSLNSCYGWGNKDVAVLNANRFSEDGSTYLSNVPRTYITNSASLAWNDLFSSRKIQNAAYWKIANVELGYNFPNEWFGKYVSDVRFYVSAQNLHTFTGYHGYNVDYAGGTFTPGYNFCSYPTARTFMCGVHFTF